MSPGASVSDVKEDNQNAKEYEGQSDGQVWAASLITSAVIGGTATFALVARGSKGSSDGGSDSNNGLDSDDGLGPDSGLSNNKNDLNGSGSVDAEVGHSNLDNIPGIQQKRAFDEFGFSVDDLLKSGSTPLNTAGVTKAGKALDKHARNQRKGSGESVFPELKGNNQQRAQQAQNFLDDILNNPNSTVTKLGRGGIKVEHPNGMQALFNKDGSFSGFQER